VAGPEGCQATGRRFRRPRFSPAAAGRGRRRGSPGSCTPCHGALVSDGRRPPRRSDVEGEVAQEISQPPQERLPVVEREPSSFTTRIFSAIFRMSGRTSRGGRRSRRPGRRERRGRAARLPAKGPPGRFALPKPDPSTSRVGAEPVGEVDHVEGGQDQTRSMIRAAARVQNPA